MDRGAPRARTGPADELGCGAPARRAVALAALAVLAVQAWVSDGYYHLDEYFQTVEFASHKLGITPAEDLAWEFQDRLRPFLQPAAYHVLLGGLAAAGVEDRGVALFVLRLSTALVGWAAMLLLWRALAPRVPEHRRTWLLAASSLAWCLPFFLVRTSSESLSAPLLAIGVAALLLLHRRPAIAGAAAGAAMGLSFLARYQVGFAIAGVVAWLLLVRRSARAAAACLAAVLAVAALGLVLDRWGYGAWTLTPWNYLRVNVLESKAAEVYGRAPPWFYVTALAGAHAPLSTALLAAVVAFWWRARRDVLTWATLPFFVAHTALARKEIRFLVPLMLLAVAMAALLVLDPALRPRLLDARPRLSRALRRTVVALDLAFVAVLLLVPVRHELSVQLRLRELLEDEPGAPVRVIGGLDPFLDKGRPLTFLRPPAWRPQPLASWSEAAPLAAGTLIAAPLGELPPAALRPRLELLASAAPEGVARVLARPVRRTQMKALWRVAR
jgi:hypothetical protein